MVMVRKYSAASLVTLLVLGAVLAGCVPKKCLEEGELKKGSRVPVQTAPEGYLNVSPDELKAMIDAGESFILLDVREAHEYEAGHISGAKLLPVGEIEKRWQELDPVSEIVVYCRSGVRSATAAVKLVKLGFKRVKNLTGGILNWPYGVIK